jgi:hypothetical protein
MVMVVLGTALPAAAAAPPEPELLAKQQVASIATTQTVSTSASSSTISKTINAYNALGQVIWSWKLARYWEWDGTKVTSAPAFDQTVFIAAWAYGWDFYGVVGDPVAFWSNCSGNHGHSCHTRKKQVQFKLVITGQTIQNELPWIRMKVKYNGGRVVSYDAG